MLKINFIVSIVALVLSFNNVSAQCSYSVTVLPVTHVTCHDLSNGEVELVISGNTSPYYYNGIEGENNFIFDNLSAGILTIEIIDSDGCSTSLSVEVEQPTILNADVDITNYCETSLVKVVPSGGSSPYEFRIDYEELPSLIDTAYYVLTAGVYTIELKDRNGCETEEIVNIVDFDQIDIIVDEVNNASCLTSSDGYILAHIEGGSPPYLTNLPLYQNNRIKMENLNRGRYLIEVTDNVTCGSSKDIVLDYIDSVYVDIKLEDEILYYGKTIELEVDFHASSDIVDFIWTPSDGLDCSSCQNPLATPLTNTYYYLDLEDENGCYSSDSVKINIVSDVLFMPSAFTPNDDGINDAFTSIGYLEGVSNYRLMIYNRVGQFIADIDDVFLGWDGIYNGEICPNGTYVWKMVYEFKEDPNYKGLVSDQGVVTIIR